MSSFIMDIAEEEEDDDDDEIGRSKNVGGGRMMKSKMSLSKKNGNRNNKHKGDDLLCGRVDTLDCAFKDYIGAEDDDGSDLEGFVVPDGHFSSDEDVNFDNSSTSTSAGSVKSILLFDDNDDEGECVIRSKKLNGGIRKDTSAVVDGESEIRPRRPIKHFFLENVEQEHSEIVRKSVAFESAHRSIEMDRISRKRKREDEDGIVVNVADSSLQIQHPSIPQSINSTTSSQFLQIVSNDVGDVPITSPSINQKPTSAPPTKKKFTILDDEIQTNRSSSSRLHAPSIVSTIQLNNASLQTISTMFPPPQAPKQKFVIIDDDDDDDYVGVEGECYSASEKHIYSDHSHPPPKSLIGAKSSVNIGVGNVDKMSGKVNGYNNNSVKKQIDQSNPPPTVHKLSPFPATALRAPSLSAGVEASSVPKFVHNSENNMRIILDDDQSEFIRLLNDMSENAPNIFLTGVPGAGKTTIIKMGRQSLIDKSMDYLMRLEAEKLEAQQRKNPDSKNNFNLAKFNKEYLEETRSRLLDLVQSSYPMCAPTAAAATLLCGGVTLHSLMKGMGMMKEASPIPVLSKDDIARISIYKIIFIDEVSMLSWVMLFIMDKVLRNHFDPRKPFGGKRIVFIGDLSQLPPITDNNKNKSSSDNDNVPIIVESPIWKKSNIKTVYLTKSYRQDGDNDFMKLLENLRMYLHGDDKKKLNLHLLTSRIMSKDAFCAEYRERMIDDAKKLHAANNPGGDVDGDLPMIESSMFAMKISCEPTIISPVNSVVNTYNLKHLSTIDSELYTFPATYIFSRLDWVGLQKVLNSTPRGLSFTGYDCLMFDITSSTSKYYSSLDFIRRNLNMCPKVVSVEEWNHRFSNVESISDDVYNTKKSSPGGESLRMSSLNPNAFFWFDPSLSLSENSMQSTCTANISTPPILGMKVGAQVILTTNLNVVDGLFNGQKGVVTHICTRIHYLQILERRSNKKNNKCADEMADEIQDAYDDLLADIMGGGSGSNSFGYPDTINRVQDEVFPVVKFVNGIEMLMERHLFEIEVPLFNAAAAKKLNNNNNVVESLLDDEDNNVKIIDVDSCGDDQLEKIKLSRQSWIQNTSGNPSRSAPKMFMYGFPLKVAAAMTIHNSQGRTCTFGFIDVGGRHGIAPPDYSGQKKQLKMYCGYLYTAISRFEKLNQFAISDFNMSMLLNNPRVVQFYRDEEQKKLDRAANIMF